MNHTYFLKATENIKYMRNKILKKNSINQKVDKLPCLLYTLFTALICWLILHFKNVSRI